MGPITTPVGGGFASVNVTLRKRLGLFANVRPARNLPALPTRFSGVDIVVVRENAEDLYAGIEHEIVPGIAESIKIITETASVRIARHAFDYARRHGRRRVTTVHKANIMKLTDGLFLRCARAVAADYPEIAHDDLIVDNMCMQLVTDPSRYDILLAPNLYGDIISDLCAGLVGGLGVAPAANIGIGTAVFEAVHGSAPDIAGKGLANPTALMLSAVLMLDHLNEPEAARRLEKAVHGALADKAAMTRDLGGTAGTREFTDAVVARLNQPPARPA